MIYQFDAFGWRFCIHCHQIVLEYTYLHLTQCIALHCSFSIWVKCKVIKYGNKISIHTTFAGRSEQLKIRHCMQIFCIKHLTFFLLLFNANDGIVRHLHYSSLRMASKCSYSTPAPWPINIYGMQIKKLEWNSNFKTGTDFFLSFFTSVLVCVCARLYLCFPVARTEMNSIEQNSIELH